MSETVILAGNLRKRYGDIVALDGLDLDVRRGEVFGIVGPNGAGKTTTIDCIAGMRRRDSGELRTLGLDPSRDSRELHRRVGLQQQESELPERMRVGESIQLFSSLFGIDPPRMELLDRVGLGDKVNSFFAGLSGGQKRRLFVALSMVQDPELIMLDELTSGLDPRGRRDLWNLVEEVHGSGRTVLLSTHYMDEAQRLCDRVAIIHRGKVVAVDTPEALIREHCPGMRLRLGCGRDFDPVDALRLEGVLGAEMLDETCIMDLVDAGTVVPVIKALSDAGVSLGDLHTERPTLEDVFMVITGREYGDADE
ncbi:MAG: ABC transporter ATP-binding protein [Candidatus Fermentibacteraceae bacterium]|nr:ABC transporter ATP-binding protein [Candidatus Fermentibacteraceae bacterium]MBN2609849.1 ABC transporter ATP-binding protein [Candidatus Fermentibacteraceae bacterium]